jgi:hypothetical protein
VDGPAPRFGAVQGEVRGVQRPLSVQRGPEARELGAEAAQVMTVVALSLA